MTNKRPNLLFVFADQWRRQAVGFLGEEPVITPSIDNFAKESMVLNNAISTFPLCSPHRACLVSGKYPLSLGMFTNCKPGCDVMLKPEEVCIGDVLKKEGYNTSYIGKWHLDLPEVNTCENPPSGARNWDAFTPPGPKRHGFDFWYSYGTFDEHLTPHYWRDTNEMIKIDKWSVEHETDVAIDYLNNYNSDEPFAMVVSYNPPHSPYDRVPEKYKAMYEDLDLQFRPNVNYDSLMAHTGEQMPSGKDVLTRNIKDYYAAVTGIDENFNRLLQTLKEKGLEENTIVVLSADHGDMLGSQGLMAKHVWYEESVGIPFVIRWPGKIEKGTTNDTLLGSPDIMPTLLGLMGIEIPNTVEGTDISKTFFGEKIEGVESVYMGSCPGRDVFLKAFKEAGKDPRAFGWRALRTERYTYVVHRGYEPVEGKTERWLYDNENDKYQMSPKKIVNLNEEPLAKELEETLKQWVNKLNDPFEF